MALVGLVGAGSAAGPVHVIQRGETLGELSRRFGVPVSVLAEANGITDVDFILAGAPLTIPGGSGAPAAAAAEAAGNTDVPRTVRRIQVPPARNQLRPLFAQYARTHGVPVDLVMALAWQESGWQTHRVSSTQAVGVMQLMPATVEFTSLQLLRLDRELDPFDPSANIRMGTRFLRYLLDRNGGDVDAALASYYQGLRSVRERGVFEDTKRFVANVKALRGRL